MGKTERLLVNELSQAGYIYKGIDDIFRQKNLPPPVVSIILKWLPAVYEDHLGSGEHLVRSLISASESFDPAVLINLFENSQYNSTIKCSIAYVLSISKTHDISGWIRYQLLQKGSSFKRAGLLDGITRKAGLQDRDELMGMLKELFDKYCRYDTFLKIYKKFATVDDIPFLEDKLINPNLTDYKMFDKMADTLYGGNQSKDSEKRFVRDITRLIESIKNRKRHYQFP